MPRGKDKKKRKVRHYRGFAPEDGRMLASREYDKNVWELWERTGSSVYPWVNLKLISATRRKRKAAYWFAWNLRERRFSRARDYQTLAEHDVTLVRWLQSVLLKFELPRVRLVKRGE